MKKILKGYKAFDKRLICKGKKFKVGGTYKEREAIICEKGFHFCINPLDTLNYYDLCNCKFAKVEASGKIVGHAGDTKKATTELEIVAKMDLGEFVKASIDFLMKKGQKKSGYSSKQASSGYSSKQASNGDSSKQASNGDYSQQASSGDSSKQASSGNYSKQASSGDYSKQASSGDSSKQASNGNYSQQASSGYSSKQASSGDYSKQASNGNYSKQASSGYSSKQASNGDSSKQASSGDYSQQASNGYSSQQASSGDYSQQASSGDYSKTESTGKNNVIANIGIEGKAKGIKGNWITLAEYKQNENNNWIPVIVKSVKIDGKTIKENVWYMLKNKKFVEV